MDLGLAGRTAVVVGGSGFIGSEVVLRLAAEGAQVVVAARDQARLRLVAERLADRGLEPLALLTVDTLDATSVGRFAEELSRVTETVDALVVAAAPSARTLADDRPEDVRLLEAVDVKVAGYLRVVRAVQPLLTRSTSARVVTVSGQNAYLTGAIAGAVRNVGVAALTKALADELLDDGITANVVHPAVVVETDDDLMPVEHGRAGTSTVAEVADVITFLASPAASGVSGESVSVGHRVRGVVDY